MAAGGVVIGVDLHGERQAREEKFDEQGEAIGFGGIGADEVAAEAAAEFAEQLALEGAVGDQAGVGGEPGFADGVLTGFDVAVVERSQVACAPGARLEARSHQEWIEFGHI